MQTPVKLTIGGIPRAGIELPGSPLPVAVLGLGPLESASARTAVFDFDSRTPLPTIGQSVPLVQTSGGVTAHFSFPSAFAFSIQGDGGAGWRMSQFSGKSLAADNQRANPLDIEFS
jgi:hypothetical protein